MNDLISENFFFIDSNHLETVTSKLYGYYIEDDIITNDTMTPDTAINPEQATGVFLYVKSDEKCIEITQSFEGGYGLFLFQKNGYFALSNSFMMLVDHIKHSFPLSFNTAYADAFIVEDETAMGYQETMVNEIRLLTKDVTVIIDKKSHVINLQKIDYKECSVPLNTTEGINLLDQWYDKWTRFIHTLARKSDQITVDLSGGMDSRATFLLFLGSNIDLSQIRVNSIHDNNHTHTEDYQIASDIARHFHFTLNKDLPVKPSLRLATEDIINISYYTKLGMHKQLYYKTSIPHATRYNFTGAAGECVRSSHWDIAPSQFAKEKIHRTTIYKSIDFTESMKHSLDEAFQGLIKNYHIKDADSKEIMWQWFINVRCRYHFGMADVEAFLANTIRIAPFYDPLLHKINCLIADNKDRYLLFILIFVRFCPELLNFPFDGGRSFSKSTIAYAQQLNAQFPRNLSKNSVANPKSKFVLNEASKETSNEPDTFLKRFITSYHKKPSSLAPEAKDTGSKSDTFFKRFIASYHKKPSSLAEVNAFTENLVHSPIFKNYFLKYYPSEVYEIADQHLLGIPFHPFQEFFPIIGIVKILHDIEVSQSTTNDSIYDEMQSFIFKPSPRVDHAYKRRNLQRALNIFKTARIDIKNNGAPSNDLEIQVEEPAAVVNPPVWFTSQSGVGHIITADTGSLHLHLTCRGKGTLTINLRATDCRKPLNKNQRLPIWIDYQDMAINDTDIFKQNQPAWHDAPYRYTREVTDGEELHLTINWQIHGYETEEFNQLLNQVLQSIAR